MAVCARSGTLPPPTSATYDQREFCQMRLGMRTSVVTSKPDLLDARDAGPCQLRGWSGEHAWPELEAPLVERDGVAEELDDALIRVNPGA